MLKNRMVKYDIELVREIMLYLKELDTDKSKGLLHKMIRPHPQQSLSEDELKIRSMTAEEREAALYGASLQKDSSTLKTLRMLCESTKSSN